MADYDPQAPNARRYPRATSKAEMDAMPRLPFNTGIGTNIFVSRERDDARYFRHGICYAEPDHAPYAWDQLNFDESHWVLEGKVNLHVEDAEGREIVIEAGPGEHIYLPAGYKYRLEASGVYTEFYWTSGPSPRVGVADAPDYSAALRKLRS